MGIYAIDRTVCYSILNWGFPTSGSLQGSQVQADCIRGGFTCLVLKYLTGPDLILNQQLWQWLQCKEYVWKSLLHNNHPGQKKSFVLKTETTSSENKSLRRIHQCEKDQTVHTSADLGHVQIIAWNQFSRVTRRGGWQQMSWSSIVIFPSTVSGWIPAGPSWMVSDQSVSLCRIAASRWYSFGWSITSANSGRITSCTYVVSILFCTYVGLKQKRHVPRKTAWWARHEVRYWDQVWMELSLSHLADLVILLLKLRKLSAVVENTPNSAKFCARHQSIFFTVWTSDFECSCDADYCWVVIDLLWWSMVAQ